MLVVGIVLGVVPGVVLAGVPDVVVLVLVSGWCLVVVFVVVSDAVVQQSVYVNILED